MKPFACLRSTLGGLMELAMLLLLVAPMIAAKARRLPSNPTPSDDFG